MGFVGGISPPSGLCIPASAELFLSPVGIKNISPGDAAKSTGHIKQQVKRCKDHENKIRNDFCCQRSRFVIFTSWTRDPFQAPLIQEGFLQ